MNRRRPGAPPGLTVHWLAMELGGEFTKVYCLSYNNKFHHYHYSRYRKRTLIDEFIVIRTSKRCYRVMYFNEDFKHFQYFSARNYRECAAKMINIYFVFKRLEAADSNKSSKNKSQEKTPQHFVKDSFYEVLGVIIVTNREFQANFLKIVY